MALEKETELGHFEPELQDIWEETFTLIYLNHVSS